MDENTLQELRVAVLADSVAWQQLERAVQEDGCHCYTLWTPADRCCLWSECKQDHLFFQATFVDSGYYER